MKKLLCLILTTVCILAGLYGCGSPSGSPAPESAVTEATARKESEPPDTSSPEPPAHSGSPIPDHTDAVQDKRETDPLPVENPPPVEPENQQIDARKTYTCTFSIECSAILDNIGDLDPEKLDVLPESGVLLAPRTVSFYEGESVYDVLRRVCRENKIHMEASFTPMYNSAYVEGIGNLYEFDCGSGSGWMYCVNGWYPNYGCSRYQLSAGDRVEWSYTCDLGRDIGGSAVDD